MWEGLQPVRCSGRLSEIRRKVEVPAVGGVADNGLRDLREMRGWRGGHFVYSYMSLFS